MLGSLRRLAPLPAVDLPLLSLRRLAPLPAVPRSLACALAGAGLTAADNMRAVRSVRLLLWRAARMSRRWYRILRPPPRRGSLTHALSQ